MAEDLAARLRNAASDPFRFDEMLDHWNAAFQEGGCNPVTADVELAADQALIEIAAREDSELIGVRLRQLIHTLPHAALAVRADGMITSMNEVAMKRTPIGPGDSVDDLPFQLENAEPLSGLVRWALDRRNSEGEVQLKRAIAESDGRLATLAILPSIPNEAEPSALVFVIDPVWRAEVEVLLARAFQLTAAESAVLMAFLDGKSMADIAAARETSVVTVRTQFQRLMEKTGAHSQAELMRNTLAISTFFQDLEPVSEVAGHPHRKRFDVMRPGGRSLDVTLSGDMRGLPVVMLSTLRIHTFPNWDEAKLADAGILVIHVWRQGHGNSDPLPIDAELARRMADDLVAPLDQLGIARCPVACFEASLVDAMRMAHHTGNRITRIMSFSSFLPLNLRRMEAIRIPWAIAMTRAAQTSPRLLRMIIIAGNKAWQAMGARRFARMQLKASPADLRTVDLPGVVECLQRALLSSISQGLDENCRTMYDAFGNWEDELRNCPLPIEMVHGDEDACTKIDDVRWLAENIFQHVSVTGVPDAGYMLPYGHPEALIDCVRSAHAETE